MRTKKKQPRRRQGRVLSWILLLITLASLVNYFRPLDPLKIEKNTPLSQQSNPNTLPWPSDAVAAIGASGYGVLASSQEANESPIPTASIAKVITALAVLKQKPLALNQQGPTLTLTQEDVDSYNHYYTLGGSLVLVANGEKITEYQAIQAMLLPSANNMADTLAKWAFGSLDSYSDYANAFVKQLQLKNTTIGTDASGLSPTTTSTPSDLVKLGIIALQNPVIAQIVAQQNATVPVAGTIPNVNRLLGKEGVNGIKTGNSDEARGCILFSAPYEVADGKQVTIVGAVMGAPTVNKAMAESLPLLTAAKQNFSLDTIVRAGQSFGDVYIPWSNSTAHAVAQYDASAITWQHSVSPVGITMTPISGTIARNTQIGTIDVTGGAATADVPLILDHEIEKPSFWWRLVRW